ncbi:MAG: Trm112 family protein [Candidatus Dormibacteria bacterium]
MRVLPEGLISLLACPACHGDLREKDGTLTCAGCGRTYPIRDGIPILLIDGDG